MTGCRGRASRGGVQLLKVQIADKMSACPMLALPWPEGPLRVAQPVGQGLPIAESAARFVLSAMAPPYKSFLWRDTCFGLGIRLRPAANLMARCTPWRPPLVTASDMRYKEVCILREQRKDAFRLRRVRPLLFASLPFLSMRTACFKPLPWLIILESPVYPCWNWAWPAGMGWSRWSD